MKFQIIQELASITKHSPLRKERKHHYPFLNIPFLDHLERTGCVSADAGWLPHHMLLDGEAPSLLPSYLKGHSMGEYVFDWAWADAYRRHGLSYYPKLVSTIPFTPATGPRIIGRQDDSVIQTLVASITGHLHGLKLSSWHILFPEQALANALEVQGLLKRRGVQYHWFNPGYRDFQDFLDRMSSRRRKSIVKERRRVTEQGLSFQWFHGQEITPEKWLMFYRLYTDTYLKRNGSAGYLNEAFFQGLPTVLGDRVALLCTLDRDERIVAAALFFHDRDTLYGRYWGCFEEYDFLHFEACYYQGIDFAIANGLLRFDAGAQGEHKLLRGFEPVETCSLHWIAHDAFREAIVGFLREESLHIDAHLQHAQRALPFKSIS